jgi:hypothetical protein
LRRIGTLVWLLAATLLLGGCTTAETPAPPSTTSTAAATASPAGATTGASAASGEPAPSAPNAASAPHSASAPRPASGAQPYDPHQLDPRVTQATVSSTIAVRGYTSKVRPPASVTSAIKRRLMREHHYDAPLSAYELDHFIPLEVGGSSNLANLWLEPIAEAKRKDQDENYAHEMVVSGAWTLARGQQYIRDHWRIYYTQ